ncbi:hypothetical protein [Neisseria cinerea]|uniref:hypothetical protein n=1 Tax=Neisseria cinerea TaxID=483 RepID=UPI0027E1BFAC|nr:hypothetical protein [Neisseria cinerea]
MPNPPRPHPSESPRRLNRSQAVQNKTLQNKILNISRAKPTRPPKPMPSETSTGRQHTHSPPHNTRVETPL